MIRSKLVVPVFSLAVSSLIAVLTVAACHKSESNASTAEPAQSAAVPSASTKAARQSWPVPVGPRLAILPGKGVGAIRFGAHRDTIERLMEFPCEVKTETLCGYNGRAVDFELENGSLVEIHIHRSLRENSHLPGASYGVFNGQFLEGAQLEMLPRGVLEFLGPAQSVEQVTAKNPWNTVERDHYDSMILEYDRVDSGNTVLGGVVLHAPPGSHPSASAQPTPSAKPATEAKSTSGAKPAASANAAPKH